MAFRWIDRLPFPTAHMRRLLPSACALCGGIDDAPVCAACRQHYFGAFTQRCRQCAATLPGAAASLCGSCLQRPPAYDATIVASDYAPPIDQLVLALKFGGRLALAPFFAGLLRDALLARPDRAAALPSLLAPVPLGAQRLQERGYNQALEIARPLSRALGIALSPRLTLRLRETSAQSLLPAQARHANLRGAFTVSPLLLEQVRGKHIGLVDDVITTGETLHEIASTLKRFGAARVTNFVFARTPH